MKTHQQALDFPPSDYDDHVSFALGQHAYWFYLSLSDYRDRCQAVGYTNVVGFDRKGTQVAIAFSPWAIVVNARGSNEFRDWVENAMMWRVGWEGLIGAPGAKIHYGFKRQGRRVVEEFLTLMYGLVPRFPNAPIYFEGHSLGSPLSLELALAASRHWKVAAIYCFDSPRTGNQAWSQWWDNESGMGAVTHRVVIVRKGVQDLVTRIPVSACGWWHLGRPQVIRDGVRYESEAAWEAVRKEQKTNLIAPWRVLTRLTYGALIHRSQELIKELRGQVDKADAKPTS